MENSLWLKNSSYIQIIACSVLTLWGSVRYTQYPRKDNNTHFTLCTVHYTIHTWINKTGYNERIKCAVKHTLKSKVKSNQRRIFWMKNRWSTRRGAFGEVRWHGTFLGCFGHFQFKSKMDKIGSFLKCLISEFLPFWFENFWMWNFFSHFVQNYFHLCNLH